MYILFIQTGKYRLTADIQLEKCFDCNRHLVFETLYTNGSLHFCTYLFIASKSQDWKYKGLARIGNLYHQSDQLHPLMLDFPICKHITS